MDTTELDRRIAEAIAARDKKIVEMQESRAELTHQSLEFLSNWFDRSLATARKGNPDAISKMSDDELRTFKAAFAKLKNGIEDGVMNALADDRIWFEDSTESRASGGFMKEFDSQLRRLTAPLELSLKKMDWPMILKGTIHFGRKLHSDMNTA